MGKAQQCVVLHSPIDAKQWLEPYHQQNKSIGFVATMGALHEGHLSLVFKAGQQNAIVCVSIFVNPLQFNNPDDLEQYPRDLNKDIKLLEQNGCNMIFTGKLEEFFPQVNDISTMVLEDPGPYAEGLEGEFRPGHFAGVKTIARRLFETVGHCKAYFGKKDFQQTLVIKSLAKEMGYPQIIICPTLREKNGLAMSSRNQQLSNSQRCLAGRIYKALNKVKTAWSDGEHNAEKLKDLLHKALIHPEIEIEYAQLRDPDKPMNKSLAGMLSLAPQALIAVKINNVRLIDNLYLGETSK